MRRAVVVVAATAFGLVDATVVHTTYTRRTRTNDVEGAREETRFLVTKNLEKKKQKCENQQSAHLRQHIYGNATSPSGGQPVDLLVLSSPALNAANIHSTIANINDDNRQRHRHRHRRRQQKSSRTSCSSGYVKQPSPANTGWLISSLVTPRVVSTSLSNSIATCCTCSLGLASIWNSVGGNNTPNQSATTKTERV